MENPRSFGSGLGLISAELEAQVRKKSVQYSSNPPPALGDRRDNESAFRVIVARLVSTIRGSLDELDGLRNHIRRTGEAVDLLPYVDGVITQLDRGFLKGTAEKSAGRQLAGPDAGDCRRPEERGHE